VSLWEAVLLGIVEGLTEYLPVSSTGHLILVSTLLGRADDPAMKSFQIVIQIGAILAVLGLYQRRIVSACAGVLGRDPVGLRLARNLAIAFVPAAVLGLGLRGAIKDHLFGWATVAVALGAGGLVILLFEAWRRRRGLGARTIEEMTPSDALVIGCAQCAALWPGTSRSLATILGALGVGLSPAAAAEFSFLLALPTLAGATVVELLTEGDLLIAAVGAGPLAVGLLTSFASAALAMRWFIAWLTRHGLTPFGVYRVVLAVAFAAVFLL
jgi:undecaprenyl-diphosphatase